MSYGLASTSLNFIDDDDENETKASQKTQDFDFGTTTQSQFDFKYSQSQHQAGVGQNPAAVMSSALDELSELSKQLEFASVDRRSSTSTVSFL